ncbi:uncharacterized protein LOC141642625 [Silene latifolia]|uniref:uncharacterized protein LOC141642625 n=1 Tax=Silene latifolia TaxID=37657 RepID=UPI003D773F98
MSPVYMNPQHSSTFPFLELKGEQQLSLPTIIGYVHDHVTSSNNTYFSGSNLVNHHATKFLAAMDYSRGSQEEVVEKLILSHGHKPIVYNPFDNRDQGDQKNEIIEKPKKCKPSKIRILQKTTAAATTKCKNIDDKGSRDQHHLVTAQPSRANSHHEANNNINGIRMCTDCHTTTTPLWRSGPQGPKSLCNACGIRQRKARRAAMAAATAGFTKDSTLTPSTTSSTIVVEAPKLVVDDITSENKLPLKKRSKTFNASWNYNDNNYNNNNNNNNSDHTNAIYVDNNYRPEEKHSFEDIAMSSRSKNYSKANSSQRVFPRDEEEGAILLMALSCGLACSS